VGAVGAVEKSAERSEDGSALELASNRLAQESWFSFRLSGSRACSPFAGILAESRLSSENDLDCSAAERMIKRAKMAMRVQKYAEYIVRSFLLLALVWLFPTICLAQYYPILPVANSPHGIIYTMFEDSKSRLWLGTIDDVYCFDGVNFYSLRRYGFPQEEVNSIAEDSDGGIWIATHLKDLKTGQQGGGLYRFFQGNVEQVVGQPILSVVGGSPGTILASVYQENDSDSYMDLYLIRKTGTAWRVSKALKQAARKLTLDPSGSVLFPCPNGWCELSPQQIASWAGLELHPKAFNVLGLHAVMRVVRDPSGCVWFRSDEIANYKCPGHPLVSVPTSIVNSDITTHLSNYKDGSILMSGPRIVLARPNSWRAAGSFNGMPTDVSSILAAKDGSIFIGTSNGLYRFMYPFQLEYWDRRNGVDAPNAIMRVGRTVYAANSGVDELNYSRTQWSRWAKIEPVGRQLHLLPGPDHTIYSATIPRGVVQIGPTGESRSMSKCCSEGYSLATNGRGKTWLGGEGLTLIKQSGKELQLAPQGLSSGRVFDMEYDARRDILWACHLREVVALKAGKWLHVTQSDGLLNDYCRSLTILPTGEVWIQYWQLADISRITIMLSGKIQIQNFNTDQRYLGDDNHFLKADILGRLWLAHNRENFVASASAAAEGNWIPLGLQDGIPSPGGNPNAFSSDVDGSIWFASGNTVVHFHPSEDFTTNFPRPSVFIGGVSLGSSAPTLAEVSTRLPYGQDATAHIGSLQFDRRSTLHFRYRLLPDQTSWKSTNDSSLNLGKLRWGTHTLQLQAQLSTGPWSEPVEQSFEVARPVWLVWPALGGYLFAGASVFFAGQWWLKIRRERKQKVLPDLAEWRLAVLSPELQQLDGTLLDARFEVGCVLARGGFATVTEGKDMVHGGQRCAIKIFRQEVLDKEWITRHFQHEVRALEKIRHPNVVQICGSGSTPAGSFYLAMEFIEGQTLRSLLEKESLTTGRVALLLRQAGSALDEIHRHGICHRDLKPENLMIRSNGLVEEQLVLIDFSIAMVKDPEETMHGLSRAAGTIYYMAPEQAIGYADPSTDIYSLTKVLIEMLTGQRLSVLLPDASMDLPERVRELLDKLRLGLSASSIQLLSAALEFDPLRRPRNAGKFANQIAVELERG